MASWIQVLLTGFVGQNLTLSECHTNGAILEYHPGSGRNQAGGEQRAGGPVASACSDYTHVGCNRLCGV